MSSPHPPGTPPVAFTYVGRGPGVSGNPVVGTPQATAPGGTAPIESIDHTVHGPHPRISYQPGTVSDPPPLDVGDIHDPLASAAPTVSPGSTANIGDLGNAEPNLHTDDGIADISKIGHGASGVIPNLTIPHDDDLPPQIELPTSAVNEQVPPWQSPPVEFTPSYQAPMDISDGA